MKRLGLFVLLLAFTIVLASCGASSPREDNPFANDLLKEYNVDGDTSTGLLVRYTDRMEIKDDVHIAPILTLSNLFYENYDDYVIDVFIAAADDTRVNVYQANDGYETPTPGDSGVVEYNWPVYLKLLNKGEALILYYPTGDEVPQFQLYTSNPKIENSHLLTARTERVVRLDKTADSEGGTNSIVYGVKRGDVVVRADKEDEQLVKKFESEHAAFIDQFQITEPPKDAGYFDEELYVDAFYYYSEEGDNMYTSRITSMHDNQLFEIVSTGVKENGELYVIEILYSQFFNKGESFLVHYQDAKQTPNIAVISYMPDGRQAQQLLYSPSYLGGDSTFFIGDRYRIDGDYAIVSFEDPSNLLNTQ